MVLVKNAWNSELIQTIICLWEIFIHILVILIRSVFSDKNELYRQLLLRRCLHEHKSKKRNIFLYSIIINNVKAIKSTKNILWKENIGKCVQNWYCTGNNHVKGKVYYEKNEKNNNKNTQENTTGNFQKMKNKNKIW